MTREYLDRPPVGWFVLDVMEAGRGGTWDWCALVIDVHPDELKHWPRTAQEAWVRLPGKFRNAEAAWAALEDLLSTRH
jgi:hypothetical protein